jgi:hypothetical protein
VLCALQENSVPVPRLHPPQPISASSNSNSNNSNSSNSSSGPATATLAPPPLWRQLLWDDVLEAKAATGMHFSLPDTDRCLTLQKLQVSIPSL